MIFDVPLIAELAGALVAVAGAAGIVTKMMTKDVVFAVNALKDSVSRDVKDIQDDMVDLRRDTKDNYEKVRHDVKNQSARIDAIEHLRTADIERIVRLETNLTALERGQARIEQQLGELKTESKEGRAEIIESLRELRSVSPKT